MSGPKPKRKLRALVITMGSERKSHMSELFAHPTMQAHFEPPGFSPGIPQRQLRSRYDLLTHAGNAGVLPEAEWKALSSPEAKKLNDEDPVTLLDILDDVPVAPGRRGSDFDVKMHYARELWQKGKGVNRGRSVLACAFAHLIAMKTLVEEGYDFILEDNVRAPITGSNHDNLTGEEELYCECAHRIREAKQASEELEKSSRKKCHLRYYGWLGSRPNLEFVMNIHCPKTKLKRDEDIGGPSIFPFPITSDIERHLGEAGVSGTGNIEEDEKADDEKTKQTKPGGTPIWGAYAYWISKEGHTQLLDSLQKDVGAFLWKGKKWRCYKVKPVDKIMPRRIINAFSETGQQDGRDHVHVTTHPAFFRAPMLTSQIHNQWDAEFCKSTEFQMRTCGQKGESGEFGGLEWSHLWLTKKESQIVEYKELRGEWISLGRLDELLCENNSSSL